jgi:hypothetical protein
MLQVLWVNKNGGDAVSWFVKGQSYPIAKPNGIFDQFYDYNFHIYPTIVKSAILAARLIETKCLILTKRATLIT